MTYIAHVTTVHPRHDTRIFIKEVASLAQALDAKVTMFVQDAPAGEREIHEGFEIVSSGPKIQRQRYRMFVGVYRMMKLILREKPDIVHFHDPELIALCLLLRLLCYKVIYDVHEDFPKQLVARKKGPIFNFFVPNIVKTLEWLGGKFFNGIVAATATIARKFPVQQTVLVQNFPISEELIVNKDTPFDQRQPNFVYVGGITPIRGASEMVAAFERMKSSSAKLKLAGNFIPESYEHVVDSLPGWPRVDFVGWADRQTVATLLSEVQAGLVVLHPTANYIDALPVKMFEYMAAGLPVIASDFPLWRSIVDGAGCGLLVDPMDPQAIADAMDWILEHPEKAQEMGGNGRAAVLSTYNWAEEASKLVGFYRDRLGVKVR